MTCFITKDGKNAHQLCRELGVSYSLVYRKLDAGMGVEEAIQRTIERRGKRGLNNAKWIYKKKTLHSICKRKNPTAYHRCLQELKKGVDIKTVLKGEKLI